MADLLPKGAGLLPKGVTFSEGPRLRQVPPVCKTTLHV
jgi:hypothetical protein